MNTLLNMIFDFMLYSFGGWIAQGIFVGFKKHHFVNTGFLYGPLVPIYGFGALIIVYLVDPFFHNPFAVFAATFLLCSILEYFTSWAMQKLFHRLWWNYSKRPFNLHGRVCLLNSSLYGLGGLVITYGLQPWVNRLEGIIPRSMLMWIDIVFVIAFVIDLGATLYHMAKVRGWLQQLHLYMETGTPAAAHAEKLLSQIQQDRHAGIFDSALINEPYAASLHKARELVNKTDSASVNK